MATLVIALPSISTDVVVLVEPAPAGVGGGMFPARLFATRMFPTRMFCKVGAAAVVPATVVGKTALLLGI